MEIKLPEGDRSLYPHEVTQAREEMGTLSDYTDDRSYRAWLGEGTRYWNPNVYALAKAGQPIKIYRAVPREITEIHPGAYVTQSRAYAQMHLDAYLKGEGHVLEGQAIAKDLIAINPNEFYYAPELSHQPLILEQYPPGEEPKKIKVGELEIPTPPPRVPRKPPEIQYPRVLSMEEYERDWKPKGWSLIIIGPTSTWREEWGEWEAIRDIVQNSLDEAEHYTWGYDTEGLWIADKGRGVAVADFLLGPPKMKPDWARGKFGEGMKIATLALIRKGWPVRVETIGRELLMIFVIQEVNGKAETLAALWHPDGTKIGTTFHLVGYTGPAFEDRFAVNLPKSAIAAEGPSLITKPFQRSNQLFEITFPTGSRIYARDIYMRDIKSLFSYNLWGFDMAPDRHGPKIEPDMWVDMGRLWCCVKEARLLRVFLQMVCDPPRLESEESRSINMENWPMGYEPESKKRYSDIVVENEKQWRSAWNEEFGENVIIRTNPRFDSMVKHLGYQSQSVIWSVRDTISQVIKTDLELRDESQERLRDVQVIPDSSLSPKELASLALARAITDELCKIRGVKGVHAAIIPPASDRVRTAGMYGRATEEIFISSDQLGRGKDTVDTVIHELAHHISGAEDLEKEHSAEMTHIAGRVVEEVARRTFDPYLTNPDFVW